MSAVKRRVNSTGRKRIRRESVDIRLRASDADGKPIVTAVANLDEYNFPSDARVIFEAYYRSSAMKAVWGTIEEIRTPIQLHLSELDNPWAALFRVKVVEGVSQSGKILGSADRLRAGSGDDADGRRSIFPILERDLGYELWKVEIDDETGPVLHLNNRVAGFKFRILENPLLGGVLLSAAFRRVLEYLVADPYEEDDPDHWKSLWLRYLKEQFGSEEDLTSLKGDEERELWVEENVRSFCERCSFIHRIRSTVDAGSA